MANELRECGSPSWWPTRGSRRRNCCGPGGPWSTPGGTAEVVAPRPGMVETMRHLDRAGPLPGGPGDRAGPRRRLRRRRPAGRCRQPGPAPPRRRGRRLPHGHDRGRQADRRHLPRAHLDLHEGDLGGRADADLVAEPAVGPAQRRRLLGRPRGRRVPPGHQHAGHQPQPDDLEPSAATLHGRRSTTRSSAWPSDRRRRRLLARRRPTAASSNYGRPPGSTARPAPSRSTSRSSAWPHRRRRRLLAAWPPTAASSTYGDAGFVGSTGSIRLQQADRRHGRDAPDGRGYWLVASDGGIFGYGDAGFYGSTGSHRTSTSRSWAWPSTPDRARATGSWPPTGGSSPTATPHSTARRGAIHLNQPIVGMAAMPDGERLLVHRGRRRPVQLRRRAVRRLASGPGLGRTGRRHGDRRRTDALEAIARTPWRCADWHLVPGSRTVRRRGGTTPGPEAGRRAAGTPAATP